MIFISTCINGPGAGFVVAKVTAVAEDGSFYVQTGDGRPEVPGMRNLKVSLGLRAYCKGEVL